MIHKFFTALYKILFGLKIREFVEKTSGEKIVPKGYTSFRPNSYYSVFKCYRTSNANNVWYEVLLHYDGKYYKINSDAYLSTKTIIQE